MFENKLIWKRFGTSSVIILMLFVFLGCQALFTYSPVAFLQRDPETLTDDEKLQFAEYALAEGDEEKIAEIYDVLKTDAADSTDPDLNYLAAQLALDLSGMPDVFDEILTNFADLSALAESTTSFEDIIEQALDLLSKDYGTFLEEAVDFLEVTYKNDADLLAAYDYFVGSLSAFKLALDDVDGVIEDLDVDDEYIQAAIKLVAKGIKNLPEDDPDRVILEAMQTLIEESFDIQFD